MLKKVFFISSVLILMLALAACSGLSIPGVSAAASNQNGQANSQNGQGNTQANGQGRNQFDPANMPVDQKLSIGILKLEGTNLAVTPEQAKTLLPLWQALKSLSTNNNTTPDEITALFQQMQDALTKDQVNAIQTMTWKQSDLQALAQQYGVQFAQGGGGNFANLTPEQRSTLQAQFANRNGGNGGGAGGGGAFFGPGGGGFGGQGGAGGNGNGQTRPTPNPQQLARRSLGGMNRIFADAVIKLLQQKAGA
jgi:hypothetical protein